MKINKASLISFGVVAEEKVPISLAWLSGVCEKLDIEYDAIDFNYELFKNTNYNEYSSYRHNTLKNIPEPVNDVIDITIKKIIEFSPQIVCVSVFSYRQFDMARAFLRKLKPHGIRAIIGGPGVWYIPGGSNYTLGWELVKEELIQHYSLGNAEEVLVDFLNGTPEDSLIGLNTYAKVTRNGYEEWTELVKKIQEKYIPPSYKRIPLIDGNKEREIFITGANGCPGKCAFCSIRKYIPYPSYRNGLDVANECYKLYKETGVTKFKRTDALANGHPTNFRIFNERIIELKKEDHQFTFEYNAMFVPKDKSIHGDDYYKLMANAGCRSLDLGIESGSERLRKEMHKGYTNDQLDWHFEMCHKYGIKNNISMFVGFPTETDEDFEENLKMLDRYQKYIGGAFNEIQHCGKFVLYTNTYIYDNLNEYNVEIINDKVEPIEWICTTNLGNTLDKRLLREQTFLDYAKNLGYKIDVYDSKDK